MEIYGTSRIRFTRRYRDNRCIIGDKTVVAGLNSSRPLAFIEAAVAFNRVAIRLQTRRTREADVTRWKSKTSIPSVCFRLRNAASPPSSVCR